MKNWKRLPALFLSGAMALSLFACKPGDSTGNPSADPSEEVSGYQDATASPEIDVDLSQNALEFAVGISPTDILLAVNGEDVPADFLLYLMGMTCIQAQQYFAYFGANLADMPEAASDLLEQGIELTLYHTLIRQKAAELGCLLTDDQAAEVQEAINQEGMEDSAALWALTDKSVQAIMEMNYYYDNVMNAVTHEPGEEELAGYLDSQGIFSVKHILLKTTDDNEDPLPENEIAAKKALAEDLLAQLQAAEDMPALFDELMHANSDDGGLASNPDGYTFDNTASLVGGFREAALELAVGQLSGIVETDYGYHIMLRQALTAEQNAEYKETIRMDAFDEQIHQWMDAAETIRADALDSLNVIDFYTRLGAYQQALSEQQQADDPA